MIYRPRDIQEHAHEDDESPVSLCLECAYVVLHRSFMRFHSETCMYTSILH